LVTDLESELMSIGVAMNNKEGTAKR